MSKSNYIIFEIQIKQKLKLTSSTHFLAQSKASLADAKISDAALKVKWLCGVSFFSVNMGWFSKCFLIFKIVSFLAFQCMEDFCPGIPIMEQLPEKEVRV